MVGSVSTVGASVTTVGSSVSSVGCVGGSVGISMISCVGAVAKGSTMMIVQPDNIHKTANNKAISFFTDDTSISKSGKMPHQTVGHHL